MIFFHKHTMLKALRSWFENNWIPLGVFLLLLTHGAALGLSDDEAYYWVLAQKPSLGYAFHPPAVAWFIWVAQVSFGWVFRVHHPGLVRLPAALSVAVILGLALDWLRKVGLEKKEEVRSAGLLLSFSGFFSLAWMMVPDIPLFLGWTLLFTMTWNLCFSISKSRPKKSTYFFLLFSAALLMLSKYSGILAAFSASLCILIWADKQVRMKALSCLMMGLGLAAIPILYWNSQHEWASLLYQLRDRHEGGGISWLRYARFWLIELAVAGPILVGYSIFVVFGAIFKKSQNLLFMALWIAPAAVVFCLQPLVADFKPHWAFVVWWPGALALASGMTKPGTWKWAKYQCAYGLTLGALILISCHVPFMSLAFKGFSKSVFDPRLDVTNDLYGWSELDQFIAEKLPPEVSHFPVIGSRYQTSAQASFSLADKHSVTFIPRSMKEMDEWPNLEISKEQGPEWPRLSKPVLYVADIRYDAPPAFKEAQCEKLARLERKRFSLLVKWIDLWKCEPRFGI